MATTTNPSQLFDCLTDEQLEKVVVKLKQLPTGSQFERRVEEGLATTVGSKNRTYEDIVDEHGDLIGYTDSEGEHLPWWLEDFEWTITADPMDSITIDGSSSIEQFENYPLDTTHIENISLRSAESVVNALNAFAQLEEMLTTTIGLDSSETSQLDNNPNRYELPEKLFVVQDSGRIDTSSSLKKWFGLLVNLCPPASLELTACLRINANIERRHAKQVLDDEELRRLTELEIFESTEPEARAYNDSYHEPLVELFDLTLPFDLEFEIHNDKSSLTDLQYAYYRGWAKDTDRISNEQQWLRMARNKNDINDDEEYRFAEFAFQLPVRIAKSNVVFEEQQRYGDSSESEAIGDLIEEFGHPINDD